MEKNRALYITCWLHIIKKWCSDYRHISVTERRFLLSESTKALLWMSALPRLALLFCIKAWNVTLSPNAPWGARDYCVHESKIEAYCWEISEALSLAIPKGQRQAWRDGKGIMLFFLRVKRNTVKLLWWAQWNLRYPDLHLQPDGKKSVDGLERTIS